MGLENAPVAQLGRAVGLCPIFISRLERGYRFDSYQGYQKRRKLMGKLLALLIVIGILYVGLGTLVEFIFLKREDKQFKLNEESALRILTWPKRLKDI
jgi:hypothetical protein